MNVANISEFLFPRLTVSHPGASETIGELLRSRAVPNGLVMVVADRIVHEGGMTAGAISSLTDSGYEVHVYAEVDGEPDLSQVQRVVRSGSQVRAVAVVGIGGGSALDTAKLVAYCIAGETDFDEFAGPVPAVANFPTLALVPTTVGTGSEATRVAMYSINGAKRAVLCPQFVPAIALLDVNLVANLPASVVAATALDALSHAVESMMSTSRNALTYSFAVQASHLILDELRPAFNGDMEAKARLQYAAFLAGASLNAGVVLGHSMSYVLGARYGLAHGVGCVLALPFCLAYNQTMPSNVGSEMAAAVLGRSDANLWDLANAIRSLAADVGLPTDLQAHAETFDSDAMAKSIVTNYPRPNNPVDLEEGRLRDLLGFVPSGDLGGAWNAMKGTQA